MIVPGAGPKSWVVVVKVGGPLLASFGPSHEALLSVVPKHPQNAGGGREHGGAGILTETVTGCVSRRLRSREETVPRHAQSQRAPERAPRGMARKEKTLRTKTG